MSHQFFTPDNTFAILGVSKDTSKYGNIVLRFLKEKGYKIYGIHPQHTEIEGITCYPTFQDIPTSIDVLITVTPPHITRQVLQTLPLKVKVWMQPGSFDEDCITFCEEQQIEYVAGACLLHTA